MVRITILNWDKYNEKRKDVQKCSWLRLEHEFPQSQSLFGVPAAERYVFMALLCLAGKRNAAELEFDPKWFCWVSGDCFDVGTLERALMLLDGKCLKVDDWGLTLPVRDERATCTLRARDGDEPLRTDGRDETDETRRTLAELPAPEPAPPEHPPAQVIAASPRAPNPTWLVWEKYSAAYARRHGIGPPKNAKNLSLCKRLTDLLGPDAPEVASFFLTHPDRTYVHAKHPMNLLVRDAEKIYAEWKTGKRGTMAQAKDEELHAGNVEAVQTYLERKGTV